MTHSIKTKKELSENQIDIVYTFLDSLPDKHDWFKVYNSLAMAEKNLFEESKNKEIAYVILNIEELRNFSLVLYLNSLKDEKKDAKDLAVNLINSMAWGDSFAEYYNSLKVCQSYQDDTEGFEVMEFFRTLFFRIITCK